MNGRENLGLWAVAMGVYAVGCSELPVREARRETVDGGVVKRVRIVSLRAYGDHTCGVDDGGVVWCWGRDDWGQVGDGRRAAATAVPTRVEGISAVGVWVGETMSCAGGRDGSLWCWGRNDWGQLGDGSTVSPRVRAVKVKGVTNVRAVAIGDFHACALGEDQRVRCWGWGGYGAFGAGETVEPQPVEARLGAGAEAIAGGGRNVCAVSDGGVFCWGLRDDGRVGDGLVTREGMVATLPRRVMLTERATGVVVGDHGGCALTESGAVQCWGPNESGEVGDGTRNAAWRPARAAVQSGAVSVFAGEDRRLAWMRDGSLMAWGAGVGTESDRVRAEGSATGLEGVMARVVEVALGRAHLCVRLVDGAVRCVGDNTYGQIGVGVSNDATVSVATEPRWPTE